MTGLTILAVVFAVYALVAGRLDRLSITAPMVFSRRALTSSGSHPGDTVDPGGEQT